MVDPGEHVSETLRREFMEEALDSGTLGSVIQGMAKSKSPFKIK